jgi:hypothetical protein
MAVEPRDCDSCGEVVPRRRRCWHCGQWVCPYCWHHEHKCEPGHTKADCEDLKRLELVRPLGGLAVRDYLNRLRYLSLAAEAAKRAN